MRIFKKSVYFLFESGSLDSPGGPSSNRRYSITGVLRRRVIMNFTSKGPAEAKSTITLRRIHLIRRPYAKRRGRRETMFDCPLSKTVKILDQRSCRNPYGEDGESERFFCLWSEIQRCGGPSILENRHNGQAKAPSTGGRR